MASQKPPLGKAERRALEEMFEGVLALREIAAKHRVDMVHYFLDMAVVELKEILAGMRPARSFAWDDSDDSDDRLRAIVAEGDDVIENILTLRQAVERRLGPLGDRPGASPRGKIPR